MAIFVYDDVTRPEKDPYLPNYLSKHGLVAYRWIQNDVTNVEKYVPILAVYEFFEIIAKNREKLRKQTTSF